MRTQFASYRQSARATHRQTKSSPGIVNDFVNLRRHQRVRPRGDRGVNENENDAQDGGVEVRASETMRLKKKS